MNLRSVRKNKGVTQTEVAKQMGVNQNTYSYWENGKAKIDNETLKKLADYFEVSVDHLLGRDEIKRSIPKEDITRENIRFALSGEVRDLTDEELEEIVNFAKFVQERRKIKK